MEKGILKFHCTGIKAGGKFPVENTGRGQNLSPEFVLENLSPKAKTIAITLEDLTHPIKNFTHWLVWNLPASGRVKSGIPAGSKVVGLEKACQGIAYGFHRYAGPKPPKGKRHTYRFTVYTLDSEISLSVRSVKKTFLRKAEKHILQKGTLTAEFGGA